MKKYSAIIFSVSFALLFLACNKKLTGDIKSQIDLDNYGKTPVEANLLLGQAYNMLRDNNITGALFLQRFTTDYSMPATGTTLNNSSLSRLTHDASDGDVAGIWDSHYDAVSRVNLVIEKFEQYSKLAGVSTADSASWKNINGQAKFLRAFLYFNLVRLYRNVPIIDRVFKNFNQMDTVANLPADRMKEQELRVYNFILSDLNEAINSLPENAERGRCGKYAALALMGKVYLNMATIEKFREKSGNGTSNYQNALNALQLVITSNKYQLKTYYPDNFIRDKQYVGNNEFIFTIEYADMDNATVRVGDGTGFIKFSNGNADIYLGTNNGANNGLLATDFGWSVFDYNSKGDIVRRFWTFEEASFYDFETNGISGLQNSANDCPGPNCEIYLRTKEPFQYARPYWFETINNTNSFRYRPGTADIVTGPGTNNRWFSIIWGNKTTTTTPAVLLAKYRRFPMTQASFTGSNYDGDMPVMRYSEVLLMYAEAANELAGPNAIPSGGTMTALQAVNMVRNRARNFVYYPGLTVNSRIIDNNGYTKTYLDIYRRVPTNNVTYSLNTATNNPVLTVQQATDTMAKYFNEISAFKGLREVPAAPVIRNFKEFSSTADFIPDFPTSLSIDDFREQLLDERWRELAGEQNSRWYDLTRYGRLVSSINDKKTAINPLTGRNLSATDYGTKILITVDNRYEYLPIPQSEMSLNNNLKQNLGY